jgi:hypothetical protein
MDLLIKRMHHSAGAACCEHVGGTSRVTTLPAPITVRGPMVTPGQIIAPPPIQTSDPTATGLRNSWVRRRVDLHGGTK